MHYFSFLPRRIAAAVSLLVAFAACGGKDATAILPDSGSGHPSEGGASTTRDAQTCVNVDLSTYDRSCDQDSDCISVEPGLICDGYYAFCYMQDWCGAATIRASEQSRYEKAVSAVSPAPLPYSCGGGCEHPVCLDHMCTLFSDGGTVAADGSNGDSDAHD